MNPAPRDTLAQLSTKLGLTQYALALLTGREERTIARYFAGGVIPNVLADWLRRLESVTISEGHVVVRFRFPARFVRRGYPPSATFP